MHLDMSVNQLQVARLYATKISPYLSSALFAMRLVPSAIVPTMGVDAGWRCYYNEEELKKKGWWNKQFLAGILVHEAWHLLRNHHVRAKAHSIDWGTHELWNVAADCAINPDVKGSNLKIPDEGCFPEKYKLPEGETAEWYFDELRKTAKKITCVMPSFGGSAADGLKRPYEMPGAAEEAPGLTKSEAALIRESVARAVKGSTGQGNIPLGAKRWADDLLQPPKVNWRRELASFLRGALAPGIGDFSYRRISRRDEPNGDLIMPGCVRHVPRTVLVEDTSGSMGTAELLAARIETAGVLKQMRTPLTVLCCDAAVHSVQKIYNISRLEMIGGGGTDMCVGIAAACQIKPKPDVLVVITDGYTGWPEVAPPMRMITVLVGGGEGPKFGKVIRVDDLVKPTTT